MESKSLSNSIPKYWVKDLDKNFKYFCKLIRKELRNEKDSVIAITGYPGTGKSNLAGIVGLLVDLEYTFKDNVCFIPTSKEIEKKYMSLPKYSILHIDEASRGLHKHKWHDKVQQKLNELYDTEREGHYLCTLLLMPRFQNFSENFRNFRIKYWINLIERGIAVVYKRDEDKDAKDPWHIDENYKLKEKKWKGLKMFERDISIILRNEQMTKNYWFWFQVPALPEKVWKIYQEEKRQSRIKKDDDEHIDAKSFRQKQREERLVKIKKVGELTEKGMHPFQIGMLMDLSSSTILHYLKDYRQLMSLTPSNNR